MTRKHFASRTLVLTIVISAIGLTESGAFLTAVASALVAELIARMIIEKEE